MKRTDGDKICKMSIRSVFHENTIKISHIVVIVVNNQSIVEEASGDEVGIGKVSGAVR